MTPRAGGMTPHVGGMTPGSSVRDKLNINKEEAFSDDQEAAQQQQVEMKSQLVAGLQSLPKPTNDFEIVVPEVSSLFLVTMVAYILYEENTCKRLI